MRSVERAFRDIGAAAERAGIAMREAGDTLTVTYPTAPTPAQLARGTDMSPFLHDARFGRGA
ncbi:hypothetical protein [Oerskovia paurometabola]|uniref:hypothetical protein n=1 Tax=Oerskovia paurometabola TaxID=162170 RepID=UPI00381081DD